MEVDLYLWISCRIILSFLAIILVDVLREVQSILFSAFGFWFSILIPYMEIVPC